ncbi:LysR family transcriptional regulator [Burkholderia ambifaria]|uniref:LysR family transcriptional regulator n=1 Tax=Burkholderia ambifaria TaxID=152480 RepID=UPI001BA307F8|nr:LysR family transcriptional regulator [Burkholderia ambifaria]MBR8222365.1 LysR family transcriptional regulator [Burkholderia ambifaria]
MSRPLIPDLSSRELQAVCTIAECGSFMAASITLNVSQPALTRTVQRVEQAIGLDIFRRTTRRLEITAAGEEFVALANRILADLRISVDSMREITDELRGQVIVSTVMSVACIQLPGIIARYSKSKPRVEIQIREGVYGKIVEDVRGGVADFGITYIDDVPNELSTIKLAIEAFHVVMPDGHPLSKKSGISLEEASHFPMVSMPKESQTRRHLEGLALAGGLVLQHAVTVSQFATVMQCVQAGVGLAILPGGAVPSALSAGLVSRPLTKPVVNRTLGIVLLKDRALTPSARGFLGQLQESWG